METEEFSEPPPPSADKVVCRAIVLSVVSCRGFVEGDHASPKEASELVQRSYDWLRAIGLEKEMSDWERGVLARKAWGEPILRHGLMIKEKDLCVGGVPIAQADERCWRMLASITQERHRASNWLIGYGSEDFYEVTTDT